jgi:hypothetical protein
MIDNLMHSNRSLFACIFTLTLAALFLFTTGLIGYSPPGHLSLDPASWRRGVWTGGVILSQVSLGGVLLLVAGALAVKVHRRLGRRRLH